MFYIWLMIAILLFVVELLTSKLTTIWFSVSAFAVMILSLGLKDFFIEFVIFTSLGFILFIFVKPTITKDGKIIFKIKK